MTNFDKSISCLRGSGYLPYTPDRNSCRSVRWISSSAISRESSADRVDLLIGAFCVGVLLGFIIERML